MQVAIVQRGRLGTFELLTRTFAGDPDVRVIWDRRVRDRRETAVPVPADRRRGDRRRPLPPSWRERHYIVIDVGPA